MLKEIELVEEEFGTQVKAIITDAASDCRKARSLVVEQLPHIISLDCFAHQVHDCCLSVPHAMLLCAHLSSAFMCVSSLCAICLFSI